MRVRVLRDDHEPARWVPTLRGLSIRDGDRVLLLEPHGAREPIVVGVVDGFDRRPEPAAGGAAVLELQPDERVAVHDARGALLLEILPTADGPTLKLAHGDVDLELPGRFCVRAEDIALEARRSIDVVSDGETIVRGELVRLNP